MVGYINQQKDESVVQNDTKVNLEARVNYSKAIFKQILNENKKKEGMEKWKKEDK